MGSKSKVLGEVARAMIASAAAFYGTGCGEMPGEGISHEADQIVVSTDFAIGIQVAETAGNLAGDEAFTPTYENNGGVSDWACDTDCFDPDSARLHLTGFTMDDVRHRDFRVCLQASDGRWTHSGVGVARCTKWASEGTSSSGMATDSDGFDPDSYRISIETRTWPTNIDQHREVSFRLRAWDKGGGSNYQAGVWTTSTGTNTQGGGVTSWTSGPLTRNPDGFEIQMTVTEKSLYGFCTPAHPCEHGFGDCNTNSDCVPGTVCVQDMGTQFGYSDPNLDVCVD